MFASGKPRFSQQLDVGDLLVIASVLDLDRCLDDCVGSGAF